MAENEDAETVYLAVRDQFIMSPAGPVSINQMAVHAAMDMYEVEDRVGCFEKVLKLYGHFLKKDQEIAKGEKRL